MKCLVKMYNYDHPDYKKKLEEYEIQIEKFNNDLMNKLEKGSNESESGPQDDELKRLLGEDFNSDSDNEESILITPPNEPEPITTFKEINIKDSIILAYSLTPDDEVIKLYLDNSKIAQEYFVIKKHDKIIEKLDKILD